MIFWKIIMNFEIIFWKILMHNGGPDLVLSTKHLLICRLPPPLILVNMY